jgi:hypothetical protein
MPPQFTTSAPSSAYHFTPSSSTKLQRAVRIGAKVVAGATVGLLAVVAVQVVYPRNVTTPLLSVNGVSVGAQSTARLQQTFDNLGNRSVTLQARTKAYTLSYSDLGSSVDTEATTASLMRYSWRERLTPFSLFRSSNRAVVQMRHNEEALRKTAKRIQQENTLPAINATVEKVKDEYELKDASKNGATYDIEQVVTTLKSAQPGTTAQVELPVVTVEPAVTTEEARTSITQLRRQTTQATYVVVDDQKFLIPQTELKSFIAISYDKKRGVLASSYNKKAIASYITRIAPKVYVAPVAATIRVHDGVTVKTTKARDGQQINEPEALDTIMKGLQSDQQSIVVKPQVISAASQFSRTYSENSKGLQILLQDWQNDTGLRAGVVIRELGGKGRSASINGSEQFIAASMAKLYLQHYLYDGVAKGKWTMNDKLGADRPLSGRLEILIVYSNNPCFHNIGNNRGWGNVAAFAGGQGFSSSNPNPAVFTTTAQDTAWYLQRLQSGTLLASSHRKQMLGYMSRQIYREGIPTGSRGSVANKVGYWAVTGTDAGIVYHPKSTYVLSIFTYGGNPSQNC